MKDWTGNKQSQISIFDFINKDYKITKPIRLIELFAGIGSQAKALKNIGTNFETSDITKISAKDLEITDTDKYCYIMTYSFPCQDLSLAGKGAGMEKGSGTRSGLLWEVERILNECDELPQVLLMENVTQVHGKKNIDDFNQWIDALKKLGYSSTWMDLNARDFGIPQNRNRTFMISILGDYTYDFPKPFELKLRLKDMLENEVDEKYYLSEKMLNCFMSNGTGKYPRKERFLQNINRKNQDIANAITTLEGNRATCTFIKNEDFKMFKNDSNT